jgi:hypothetical protein
MLCADTSESVVLCECAGYDVILVETVGVGQSEVAVSDCCDMVLLLVSPGGGDELQGMKKGIVEIADLVVVNKADAALLPVARDTKVEYMHALQVNAHSYPRGTSWTPTVRLCSAVESAGSEGANTHLKPIWSDVLKFRTAMGVSLLSLLRWSWLVATACLYLNSSVLRADYFGVEACSAAPALAVDATDRRSVESRALGNGRHQRAARHRTALGGRHSHPSHRRPHSCGLVACTCASRRL